MLSRAVVRSAVLLLFVALAGCGGALGSVKSDFKSGRISEAKDRLDALEPASKSWSGSKHADYVLYRGLVSHALGDREEAAAWLRQAKALEDASPGTYSEDDRTRLELSLDALGPVGAPTAVPAH